MEHRFNLLHEIDDETVATSVMEGINEGYEQLVSIRAKIYAETLGAAARVLREQFEGMQESMPELDATAISSLESIIARLEADFTDISEGLEDGTQASFFTTNGLLIGVNFDAINKARASIKLVRAGLGSHYPMVDQLCSGIERQLCFIEMTNPAGPRGKQLNDVRKALDCRKGAFDWRFLRMGGTFVAGLLVALGTGVTLKNWWKGGAVSVDYPTIGWAGALALLLNGGLPKSQETQALSDVTDIRRSIEGLKAAGAIKDGAIACLLLEQCQENKEGIRELLQEDPAIRILPARLSGLIPDQKARNSICTMSQRDLRDALYFFSKDFTSSQLEVITNIMKNLGQA